MTIPLSHLCRHMRWKSQSRDSGDPHWVVESLMRSQTQFSCLKTCYPWGPDDDAVAPECCTPQRACYTPDPLVARSTDVS